MFITILLLPIVILLVYNYYVYYGRNGRLINLIPGPKNLPIIGYLLHFQGLSAEKQLKLLYDLSNLYYPIFKLWALFTPVVFIRHPDDFETILSNIKHIEKSHIYKPLLPWFNTGLLTSAGTKWQTRRKLLTPAFHFKILNQFVEILIKEGDFMAQCLKDIGGTVVKDLVPFTSEHTLNAICETAMGISLQKLGKFQQQYRSAIHEIIELIVYRLLSPWIYNNLMFALSSTGRKQKRILKILHGFTEKIIAERKLYHKRTNGRYLKNLESDKEAEIDDAEVFAIKKKRLAMLDLLIMASQDGVLTDLDIREEIDTFMFEGHDTTAMGLTFALLLLAEHKDIQERVRAEIDTAMQENGGKLTMKSLQDLSYLDRCLKEVLRLYPSVPFISRTAAEDVKLQSYVVPAGTILFLQIFGSHRDLNFWPNPEVFDPDRFLPEKIQNRHPYSYVPFSAGPRNCIGQRFGMLELKAMIVSLIHNFYLEPVDHVKDVRLKVDIALWNRLCDITDKYYPFLKIWGFFLPLVSLRHPDDLETILSNTKHIEKSLIYDMFHPWLNRGLLTSTGTKWQTRRKLLTPTFHFKILNQFVEILIKEGDCMTQSLKDTGGTVVKDLVPFISEHTLNAICETSMGISLQELGKFQQQYRNGIHQIIEIIVNRVLNPFVHHNLLFALTPEARKQKQILKILHGFTEKIIAERKHYHERTNNRYLKDLENDKEMETDEVFGIKKKRLAMLDLLLASRQDLSDSDIREEVDTFVFEGHDTTGMGITFALLLLAAHKDIQERVRAEVDTVMQENGGKLTMKSLQDLSYLDRCLKETLRLYPSVFLISRKTAEDVKLHSYVVPAGTILHLHIYGVHRDPNFWPNPDVFDPDRFLPEKIQSRHPYSYLPFSAGPRNCIGQRFAMLELKAMIAPLVHNFYLEPVDLVKNVRLKADVIIRPSHPVRVKFVPIEGKQST
ncbi:cytochrome P450 4C1-like [Nylanderia fulva]|uniref:cytochrome P450 4C1-like n=1 Tax=Nylanderia fulva TaxID=613905 RepID=UPI0010FAF004|nr:cytochrome P450 4C1-like [Nylanderia fulva]